MRLININMKRKKKEKSEFRDRIKKEEVEEKTRGGDKEN